MNVLCVQAVESALENPLDKDLTAITLNGKELRKSTLPKADIFILRSTITLRRRLLEGLPGEKHQSHAVKPPWRACESAQLRAART